VDTQTTASASQVTNSGNTSASGSLTGSISKAMNKDDFLKLLVTQLQYQDPMSPEDPKDFVAQLAQFSSLEQQINSNSNLENLGKVIQNQQQSQNMAQGVSLLGKTVKGSGNQLTVVGGKAMQAAYSLPKSAKQVVVGVFDASGNQVDVINLGAQAAGSRTFSWDGKDSKGQQAADGLYSYQVGAQDQSGNAIEVENYFTGTVNEVRQDSKGVWVTINGRQILIGNVTSVLDGS
jgi:flagellar basal-body rod modification protein FlgD